MRKHSIIKNLSLDSIMASLYLALCFADISVGRFKLTLAAIVPLFVCFTFPLADSYFVCILGVFLNQLLYGLSPTTIIWMIPPLMRVFLIPPFTMHYERKKEHMEDHKFLSISLIIISSILVSLSNSGALILDSIIIGYSYQAVWVDNIIQIFITIVTCILECFLLFPLVKALRKSNLLPTFKFKTNLKDTPSNR